MGDTTTPEPHPNRAGRRAESRRLRKAGAVMAAIPAAFGTTALLVGATAGSAGASPLLVTNLDPSGAGSLHDVAEGAGNGDVITFKAGLSGPIVLTDDIDIDTSITIDGPGAGVVTVSGNDVVRIFDIDGPGSTTSIDVTITGLTLSHGRSDGGSAIRGVDANVTVRDSVLSTNAAVGGTGGGAIRIDDTDTDLVIERSELTGNTSDRGAGAIYFESSYGTITVTDSTLSGNTTTAGVGGALWAGGYLGSVAEITGTTVTGNSNFGPGGTGGGLALYTKSTTVRDTVITDNHTDTTGGGLYLGGNRTVTVVESTTIAGNDATNDHGNATGGGVWVGFNREPVTFRNSTISGNSSSADGGGITVDNESYGLVTIENSTISGNTADGDGGGVFFQAYYGLAVIQSTITANTASTIGGIAIVELADTGAQDVSSHGKDASRPAAVRTRARKGFLPVVSTGSIIAKNTAGDVGDVGELRASSSLLGTVTGTTFTDGGGNLRDVDPRLGPLQDNGGPTKTHALLDGSPAINAGPDPLAPFPGSEFDQRGPGYDRVVGGRVDIGAFEVQPTNIEPAFTG